MKQNEFVHQDAETFYSEYEPLEVLGKGISSIVRKCVNRTTGDHYAVKVIDLLCDEAPTRDEVQNEINLLCELRGGQNIIELYDVYVTSTCIFLVFELMKCELFDHLNNVIRLDERQAKKIMRKILLAVQNLHENEIIHRDIKLENVLIDDNFNVKLTDFGFACKVPKDSKLRSLYGTQVYMAPEVLKCGCDRNSPGYSFPADIWSCGVLMAILLTGSSPFYHRREIVMLRSIMEARYSMEGPDWAGISKNAKILIKQMLTLDQSKRITAQEALDDMWFMAEIEFPRRLSSPTVSAAESIPDTLENLAAKAQNLAERKQKARRRFKSAVYSILMLQFMKSSIPIRIERARREPYGIRPIRVFIDNAAFRVYGHWVKKHNGTQERNALFQRNIHRTDPEHSHGTDPYRSRKL